MFKILSTREYNELLDKVNGATVDPKIKQLEDKVEKLTKDAKTELQEHETIVKNLKEDYKILLARKDSEVETKVNEKTKDLTDTNQKLTIENNSNKKEVEILTKAFENLGFDVKDMKDILNKLVDGIVSKNSVNVIKS